MTTDKFQCPELVAPGRQCIRAEGHDGSHSAGIKLPIKGTVCECVFCAERFSSIVEFDAHAPCPKA